MLGTTNAQTLKATSNKLCANSRFLAVRCDAKWAQQGRPVVLVYNATIGEDDMCDQGLSSEPSQRQHASCFVQEGGNHGAQVFVRKGQRVELQDIAHICRNSVSKEDCSGHLVSLRM